MSGCLILLLALAIDMGLLQSPINAFNVRVIGSGIFCILLGGIMIRKGFRVNNMK